MKFFIKIFLATGPIYGSFITLWFLIKNGPHFIIEIFLFATLSFGLCAAIFSYIFNYCSLKRLGIPEKANDIFVSYSKTIKLFGTQKDIYEKAKNAVLNIGVQNIIDDNIESGQFAVITKQTWKSFGEKVTFSLEKLADESFQLNIFSKPAKWYTLVDYGKNYKNVEIVTQILEKENMIYE
jgi:hypothetical protein